MREVRGQTIQNQTILLDECYFIECKIIECTVLYGGGDFGWTDTSFDKCALKLEGPAIRTLHVLNAFGAITPEFSKEMGLEPIAGESPLLVELEKARDVMLQIKGLGGEYSYFTYSQEVKRLIGEYFTPKSTGSAKGEAGS